MSEIGDVEGVRSLEASRLRKYMALRMRGLETKVGSDLAGRGADALKGVGKTMVSSS